MYKKRNRMQVGALISIIYLALFSFEIPASEQTGSPYILVSGHPSLHVWKLPAVQHPDHNPPSRAKVDLGRKLFFDPNLSRDQSMSCATCHAPELGWSDARTLGEGFNKQQLSRGTPTILNAAYTKPLMWDGRFADLEAQALGPITAPAEMNMKLADVMRYLQQNPSYRQLFAEAFPDESINKVTLGKAIAAFERTIVLDNSSFDRWIAGDRTALTPQQVAGFRIFLDNNKGNCASCHHPPAFTDNGFHNIGLASFEGDNPDPGRFKQVPVKLMQGAFKTPQLRGLTQTAPYFHDGSAQTLADVVDHYIAGGAATGNLSPGMKPLTLTKKERLDLIAFLEALSPSLPLKIVGSHFKPGAH